MDPDVCFFMEAPSATLDSYIEFFAEQDLLKHMSRGDLSTWGWDMADEAASSTEGSKEMKETCRSIKVDIWDIAEEKRVDVLRGWELLRCPEYRGMHGMGIPNEGSTGRCVRTDAQGMLLGMGTEFFWTELVIPNLLVLDMLIVEAKD